MNHNNKSSSASPPPPSTHPTPYDSSPFTSILQMQLRPLVSRQWGLHQSRRISRGRHSSHSGSALLHRTQSLIHYKIALQISNSATVRLEHLNKALESSRQVLVLSPKAISFLPLHAILLFELAQGDSISSGYEAVIQQYEHALLIQNPTGPASSVEKSKKRLVEIIEKSQAKIILLEWRQLLEAEVMFEFKAMQQRDLVSNHDAEKKTDKVDVNVRQERKSKDNEDVCSSEQQHSEPPQTNIAWFLMLFQHCDVSRW